ncbi:MAG: hypothetical protein HEQ39_09915 [Rhizobacter sp.]
MAASALSFTVLVTLKVVGFVTCGWLWVLLPIWWPLVPFVVLAVVAYLVMIFEVAGSVFK